jgi:hypothetical protein
MKDIRSSMEATLGIGIDRLFVIEIEYSLALLEAERIWILQLMKDIESEVITVYKKDQLCWAISFKETSQDFSED